MMFRRSGAIVRQDLRVLRREPIPLLVFILMPLMVMAFNKPAFRAALIAGGVRGANGAEQAVPGTAVLFALFLVANVGLAVYREHSWGTWDRIRASWATPAEILAGKAVTPTASALVQLGVLFGVGGPAFCLHVRGSVPGLILVMISLALCLVALGFALMTLCKSLLQLNAAANLGALLLGGLGGAIAPVNVLPGWARVLAPLTPSYWAMRGFRTTILHPGGMATTLPTVCVLATFTAAFFGLTILRFRMGDIKTARA